MCFLLSEQTNTTVSHLYDNQLDQKESQGCHTVRNLKDSWRGTHHHVRDFRVPAPQSDVNQQWQ